MRIVIDVQGAQSTSRFRGIGRYSHSIALAIANKYHDTHDIIIILNAMLTENIDVLYQAFLPIIGKQNIKVWHGCGPTDCANKNNDSRIAVNSLLIESFIASLKPDIILVTSVIEGYHDNSLISSFKHYDIPTAVIFYDVIPLINPDKYITPMGDQFKKYYYDKIDVIKNATLVFGISQSSCDEAIDILHIEKEKISNISSAADNQFTPKKYSQDEINDIFNSCSITKSFIMYSGATDERKNHIRLIKAFSLLPQELKNDYQLVLAGGMPIEHKMVFQEAIKKYGLTTTDVVFTNRISDYTLVALYNLCHLYVFPSYHEGFGLPALEAMQCGAACIGANTTSVPEVIGKKEALFNPYDEKSIADKIIEVLTNESFRKALIDHGIEQSKKFSWERSAAKIIERIEKWGQTSKTIASLNEPVDYIGHLVKNISKLKNIDKDLYAISQSIALNHPNKEKKQLLVDVSELVKTDAKSGIQRVVKNILMELISFPPEGYDVHAIYANSNQYGYLYANKFINNFLKRMPDNNIQDNPIDIAENDIFLGLDMSPEVQVYQKPYFLFLQQHSVDIHFIVYDILLLQNPQWWPEGTSDMFEQWLKSIAEVSTGLVCISNSVADEVKEWILNNPLSRLSLPEIASFHLGADIDSSIPSHCLTKDTSAVLSRIEAKPSFLMVGTIEPKKGHFQVLQAFEKLWEKDFGINLVIVGKAGWLVDGLVQKLKTHPELNKRLFWLEGISDEYLEKVYGSSSCLIAASEGEGFGLPLIEAAQHKIPIIARDIPVFREVVGEYAYYFENDNDKTILSDAIVSWLELYKESKHPKSDKMPWLTWEESTKQLLSCININLKKQKEK